MNYLVESGDEIILIREVDLATKTAIVGDDKVRFDFQHIRNQHYSLIINDQVFSVRFEGAGSATRIRVDSYNMKVTVQDEQSAALRKYRKTSQTEEGSTIIKAPMPGLIIRLNISEGDMVEEGQSLVVIEAMKMENEIKTLTSGTVAQVLIKEQQSIEKGAPLMKITN